MTCRLCAERTATGCLADLADTPCFTTDGTGTEADPFTISPVLDATAGNLITCGANGLLASLPTTVSNPPACSISRESNLSVAHNTLTVVPMQLEIYDTDTMHSTVTNTSRITFTTAGTYIIDAYVIWDRHTTGDRTARIRKNGVDTLAFDSKDAGDSDLFPAHALSADEQFVATDYIEILVQQTSGVTLDVYVDLGAPVLSVVRRAA